MNEKNHHAKMSEYVPVVKQRKISSYFTVESGDAIWAYI
jgi:hypothetical protein